MSDMFTPQTVMTPDGQPPTPPGTAHGSPIRRWSLAFKDRDCERAYRASYWKGSSIIVRISLLLGGLLYILFGFLDTMIAPEAAERLFFIRLPITTLFVTIAIGFPAVRRHAQLVLAASVLVAGAGVLAMIAILSGEGGKLYYAGLILVIIFAHTTIRLRFVVASLVSALIVLAYVALAFISASTPGHILLSNSFFLVSAHILGMFSSYGIEFYARTAFWQRRLVMEQQKALEREHERKTRELAAARDVQISMLPRSMPDHPLLELSVSMRTAAEIGGDYYDVIVAPDGTLTFTLADAAGHGARTGAMVAAMKVMFSNHAADDDIERFVERASIHMRAMHIPGMFMSAIVGRIRGEFLEIVGAGMPAALLRTTATREVISISLKGVPLGAPIAGTHTRTTLCLSPGDLVVFMTDGVTEQVNPQGEMFGEFRARSVLEQGAGTTAQEVLDSLFSSIDAWAAGCRNRDDISLLVIRKKA